MRTITIEIHDGNDYTVREGDRYCDKLCWDEMLGQIVHLSHPRINDARYSMFTAEEHAAKDAKLQARLEEIRSAEQESQLVLPDEGTCINKPPF